MNPTKKEKRKKELEVLHRKIKEYEAQLAHVYHFADATLDKASTKHLAASGVVVTMTALGGRELINPVLIRDGLSDETIAAFRKDLERSYLETIKFKPKSLEGDKG